MIKIMFVCHGNICRSPMAEFIMKDMVYRQSLSDKIHIASCATSTEEIWGSVGNPVYPPARRELALHGIDAGDKRAVQLKKSDYDSYDLLVAMDDNNIRNIFRIIGSDPQGKVKKLLDFTPQGGNVADPWYNGHFDVTYNDIYKGCQALMQYLAENGLLK